MPSSLLLRLAAAAALLALGACSTFSNYMSQGITTVITPYKVEVVQGNVVTREQINGIKPGMPRNRVRDLLGSPLLADPFHAQRWDYVFVIRRAGTEPQQRSVVIMFENDVVKTIEAPPDLPGELEFVASITKPGRGGDTPKLELSEEERKALPPPPPAPATTVSTAPQGAVRSYPPLE